MTWTWDKLTRADRATFRELMATGGTPDPAEIAGHTYAGLNRGLVPKLTGERFQKVFHAGDGDFSGHNVVPRRGGPVEIGWFGIRVDGRTMRFDYDVPQNAGRHRPLRGIQDDVVLPNSGDHELLLGRARMFGIPVAHFVLMRQRDTE